MMTATRSEAGVKGGVFTAIVLAAALGGQALGAEGNAGQNRDRGVSNRGVSNLQIPIIPAGRRG